jgi:hypothetical protein
MDSSIKGGKRERERGRGKCNVSAIFDLFRAKSLGM